MSECVVRMEMPEKCAECPAWSICGTLHKYMLGIDCDSDWTYDDLLVITVETGFVKPDNCPIICQLPEGHGRLVDADEIQREMYHGAFETDTDMQKWDSGCWIRYKMFENTIGDVPTVVPAERSET